MKRIFLFVILIGSIAGFYFFRPNVFAQPQQAIDEGTRRQILAATVQIKLSAPLLDEAGNPVVAESNGKWHVQNQSARGLGTLVRDGEGAILVTHDHWGDLLLEAETVQFKNADGELLAEISGVAFRSLLRYRDQGTLLLEAPQQLAHLAGQAVERGDSGEIMAGRRVLITRRQVGTGRVELIAAVVTGVAGGDGVATYQLLSVDGTPVVKGDSGGGIWAEEKLVGNMWWTVLRDDVATDASGAAAYTETIEESLAPAAADMLSGGGAKALP